MSRSFSSVAEYYRSHEGYSEFVQEHRSGGAYGLTFIEAEQSAHNYTDPPVDELVLTLSLMSHMPFRWDLGDGWSDERQFTTGGINVCPANTAIQYDCRGDHQILMVASRSSCLSALLDEYGCRSSDVFGPLHAATIVHDGLISSPLKAMWLESAKHGDASAMMIDGLWQMVVAQLLRRAHLSTALEPGYLSASQLDRVEAYLDAKLHEPINTENLASLIDQSPARFSHELKHTTGQTPHQYVLSRRIARAQELLATGDMPLVEIAYACGFASQSHMTDVFRQKLGVTPGRYRKEVRS